MREKQLVDECLLIHTLETGDDSFLHLNVPENQERITAAIALRPWTGVVFDVLRDYAVDDLSADQGMQETLAVMSRLCRKNNPHCIIGIMHHARTGKAGAASATGFDRSSFGRNSKVLLSWVRSQINIAPFEGDNNEVVVISSAKCNNAPEFTPVAARLDFKTMMYDRDEDADIAEWEELVGGNTRPRPKVRKTAEDLLAQVPDPGDISKNSLLAKAGEAGIGEKKARGFIDDLRDAGKLFEYAQKRSGLRDEIRVSRYAPGPPDASNEGSNSEGSKRGNNKPGKRVSGKR